MDCSLPGLSVHGILQARKLEGVAISFDYAYMMASCIKTIRVDELATNYHHSPNLPRLSTTNLFTLPGSIPVFVFNLVLAIT